MGDNVNLFIKNISLTLLVSTFPINMLYAHDNLIRDEVSCVGEYTEKKKDRIYRDGKYLFVTTTLNNRYFKSHFEIPENTEYRKEIKVPIEIELESGKSFIEHYFISSNEGNIDFKPSPLVINLSEHLETFEQRSPISKCFVNY